MRREEDRLVVGRRMVVRRGHRLRMPSSKAVRISLLRSGMRGGNVWVVLWLWCVVGRRGWRMLVGGGLWRFWARGMGREWNSLMRRWRGDVARLHAVMISSRDDYGGSQDIDDT